MSELYACKLSLVYRKNIYFCKSFRALAVTCGDGPEDEEESLYSYFPQFWVSLHQQDNREQFVDGRLVAEALMHVTCPAFSSPTAVSQLHVVCLGTLCREPLVV